MLSLAPAGRWGAVTGAAEVARRGLRGGEASGTGVLAVDSRRGRSPWGRSGSPALLLSGWHSAWHPPPALRVVVEMHSAIPPLRQWADRPGGCRRRDQKAKEERRADRGRRCERRSPGGPGSHRTAEGSPLAGRTRVTSRLCAWQTHATGLGNPRVLSGARYAPGWHGGKRHGTSALQGSAEPRAGRPPEAGKPMPLGRCLKRGGARGDGQGWAERRAAVVRRLTDCPYELR